MNSAAGGHISVVAFSVSSVPVNQTLHDNGSRIKAWFPGVDRSSSANTVLASVILLPRDVRPTSWGRSGHSTPIITIKSVIILVTPTFTSLAPRRQSWAMSRLNYIRSDGSTVSCCATVTQLNSDLPLLRANL